MRVAVVFFSSRNRSRLMNLAKAVARGTVSAHPRWALPGVLAASGYRTHSVGKIHLTPTSAPAEHGFAESSAMWASGRMDGWTGPYYGFETEVIVASVRNALHVVDAAIAGAPVVTCPFNVIELMFKHPLTDAGIKKFLEDWDKIKKRCQGIG